MISVLCSAGWWCSVYGIGLEEIISCSVGWLWQQRYPQVDSGDVGTAMYEGVLFVNGQSADSLVEKESTPLLLVSAVLLRRSERLKP